VNVNEVVTYASDDRIARITINRPGRMNAPNEVVIVVLQATWRR